MTIRLTELAHGGGCGCKLAPALLADILAGMPAASGPFADLLVGHAHGDDAAVWRLDAERALVATTDFFNPIVDDARDFGRIAATNALSDVWAMGGRPIFALAILGVPRERLPVATVRDIVAGGAAACAAAGVPVAGGHSIDCPEPIYGLAAIGLVHPDRVRTNGGARAGDRLLLTKGLGIGVYGAALRAGALPPGLYARMIASTTRLNDWGAVAASDPGCRAMTDVTGFGLLGHALEMCRASGVRLRLDPDAVPVLEGVRALARAGHVTGASGRNWASYGEAVRDVPDGLERALLTDPQTSGGLLVAAAPDAAERLLRSARAHGHADAAIVGVFEPGEGVRVEPSARRD